jgi:hypothetical protein
MSKLALLIGSFKNVTLTDSLYFSIPVVLEYRTMNVIILNIA